MKSIFTEKSLGIDIREQSVSLTFLGKKLRSIEVLAEQTIDYQALDWQRRKGRKAFPQQGQPFHYRA